jgi:hypothetical protein
VAAKADASLEEITPVAFYAKDSETAKEKVLTLTQAQQSDPYDFIQSFLEESYGLTSEDDDMEMLIDTVCDGLLTLDFTPSSLGKIISGRGDLLTLSKPLTAKTLKQVNYLASRTADYSKTLCTITRTMSGIQALDALVQGADDDTFLQRHEITALAFKSA